MLTNNMSKLFEIMDTIKEENEIRMEEIEFLIGAIKKDLEEELIQFEVE